MRLMIVALVCALFAAPAALADSPAERQALAERYVRISMAGFDKLMQQHIDAEAQSLADVLSEEHSRWLRANTIVIMNTHLRPMVDGIARDYAERFTQDELTAMVAFYEGPMGREIARKEMEAGLDQNDLIAQFQIGFLTDLFGRFCATFDCEAMANEANAAAKPARR